MRVLVTGGGGFVGQWLARDLLKRGDDVTLAGNDATGRPKILDAAEWRAVRWCTMDMRDDAGVVAAIDGSRPDIVVHLAGVSYIPSAASAPTDAFDVNVVGAVRLLSRLADRRQAGTLDPVVIVVGSGMQYGAHDAATMPLDESAEQRPLTTYAATKAVQEVVALQLFRSTGLRVICTRSFNHSGPGHDPRFLLPSLVDRVLKLSPSGARTLFLGNDSVRDYLHVADVVRAYLLLAERGTAGEVYNVASGIGVSVRGLAEAVMQRAGIAGDIATDPSFVRDADVPVLVGDPGRLMRTTGWTITRTNADIIDDLLHAQTA